MNGQKALFEMEEALDGLESIPITSLKPAGTLLVVVDMVNGFARKGALSSERIEALIPAVSALSVECSRAGIKRVALADRHSRDSIEFESYPPHCLEGTEEAELISELKEAADFTVIGKNSTNGFLEEEFLRFLGRHPDVDTFILAGDCTDICILQLALTLKAHFNRLNQHSRILVPKNAVATFDAPGHDAWLMNLVGLNLMKNGGIEIVERISPAREAC